MTREQYLGPINREGGERWPVTVSVAVYLCPELNKSNGLILVRVGGRWGLPAGGLEPGEFLDEAVRREIEEETGIAPGNVEFHSNHSLVEFAPIDTICLPGDLRTQLGLVFSGSYRGPKLDSEGWLVTNDEKVGYAKPWKLRDILELVKKEVSGESVLYKPHFNLPLLIRWIYLNRIGMDSRPTEYILEWAKQMEGEIEGLNLQPWLSSGKIIDWDYQPPHYGEQDPNINLMNRGIYG